MATGGGPALAARTAALRCRDTCHGAQAVIAYQFHEPVRLLGMKRTRQQHLRALVAAESPPRTCRSVQCAEPAVSHELCPRCLGARAGDERIESMGEGRDPKRPRVLLALDFLPQVPWDDLSAGLRWQIAYFAATYAIDVLGMRPRPGAPQIAPPGLIADAALAALRGLDQVFDGRREN